ncbi:glycoside hydrolase family 79 protein [Melanogaster broomeanus]|nr:glycoside hydrolase family 79 protein [Melanogaster broomeanus]
MKKVTKIADDAATSTSPVVIISSSTPPSATPEAKFCPAHVVKFPYLISAPGAVNLFTVTIPPVGNEPDQYSLDFDAQNYTAIWEPWSVNISQALDISYPEFQVGATAIDPLWPYNTSQADTQFDCASALAAGADDGHTVKTCSEHTYQYSVCDPTRAAVATLTNLVNHTRLAEYLDLWQPRIHRWEFNSVSCSGRDNVSNTFGQAMWLLDTALYAASINVSRVYVHQGGPLALQSSTQLNHGGLSFYNLWYPVDNQNGPIQVFPSYSAYLFVSELIGGSKSLRTANIFPGRQANGSSITTADGDPSAGQVSVYGYWEEFSADYPAKLAILNLEIYNSTATYPRPNITVDFSAFLSTPGGMVTVKRLTAPGADIKYGNLTTWAGQNFASGVAEGGVEEEIITTGEVDVAASSAVLVTFFM